MRESQEFYYEAIRTRDPRFDGKFFSAVKTTGIYCRSICPARPYLKNLIFYETAWLAEQAGYRPCLRCRPESAPGSGAWLGKNAVVRRAIREICNSGGVFTTEEEFAATYGLSSRQLRRLFKEEIGLTPKQLGDYERLNFSRKLLADTALAINRISTLVGFGSVRRFNSAFKVRFKASPGHFRKLHPKKESAKASLTLKLSFRPPYDWQAALSYYERHHVHGVRRVENGMMERVFRINGKIGAIRVSYLEKNQLLLEIFGDCTDETFWISTKVRQMFDLDCDPLAINEVLKKNKCLKRLIEKRQGLRLISDWDFFEICVCVILGQLVSVDQANRLIKQLIEAYGEKVINPANGAEAFLFPPPELLLNASMAKVATTEKRREAIRHCAHLIIKQDLIYDTNTNFFNLREELLSIPGIGPWTVENICLRGLSDSDAFPASDLILKRAIDKYPSLKKTKLSPWSAYAAIHLWQEFAIKLSQAKRKS